MELWDFIITGTAAYGPQTPGESDIDIVLMEEDAKSLLTVLNEKGIPHRFIGGDSRSDLNYPAHTYYFVLGMLQFNIIRALDEANFTWWKARTELMKRLKPIEDRAKRLRVFNQEVLP